MQSNNPVLRRAVQTAAENRGLHEEGQQAFDQADVRHLEQSYAGASYGERTLQIPDVVAKTGIALALVAAGAMVGWQSVGLGIIAMFVGLGLGFVNSVKRQVVPALVLGYAAAEGLFLGAISHVFSDAYAAKAPNLVGQAVLGTVVAFAVMLALYSNRIIRVNGKFTKIMMGSLIAYGLIGLVSFVLSFTGLGQGWGFYGVGQLGLLLCLAGVVLAAFTLALDFDLIEQGVRHGLPERESWRMAFALTSTLVWLYVEILRLLAILTRR